MAFNPREGALLAANVPTPGDRGPVTVSIINVTANRMVADIPVPGRTRWAVYDRTGDVFYVNISEPAQIAILNGKSPDRLVDSYRIPAIGPHGLDLDERQRRLFCACDKEGLYTVDIETRKVSKMADLAGPPDVIFHNPNLDHLYVAISDPGIVQVFDTNYMKKIESVKTERGTHTLAFDQETDKVYAFMPETSRASVFLDE